MNYQRPPNPPNMPAEVRDLERLIAAYYPTPEHYLVPTKLYDTLVSYLNDYDRFAREMGWTHRDVPGPKVPAVYGQTGLCYIRRHGT